MAYVLRQAAALNAAIGRAGTADEYTTHTNSLVGGVNKHCWNGNMYVDGPSTASKHQHSQVFAILAGAIEGEQAADLMRRSLTDSSLPKCSYAMPFYVLRAAAQTGVYEDHFELFMQPWQSMVKNNLTTWAEDDVMFSSDCHGWSSSPIYEIVHEIFGMGPASDGYEGIVVAPWFRLK